MKERYWPKSPKRIKMLKRFFGGEKSKKKVSIEGSLLEKVKSSFFGALATHFFETKFGKTG